MMTILYEVRQGLYVNLTNKCCNDCTFCLRNFKDREGRSGSLWLDHEPDFGEVREAFRQFDVPRYKEVVICRFGEPTEALERVLQTAGYVKEHWPSMPVRINTNGLGNLINGRNIVPLFKNRIDTVSISLNTPDKERYLEVVRPAFGEKSFDAMLDFARECVRTVPHTVLSTVATTISREDEEKCAAICREIGAAYRIREFEH